jgi:signal transduction histidine kinase
MKSYWTQPSLSRDFALLSAAIVFLLFLISAWVTYTTYNAYSERIANDMEKESQRIGYTFATEMDNANYMLTALGKQIIIDGDRDLVKLAKIIKSFDSNEHIYTALSWIDPTQRIVISSNTGILEKPVDVSDRDYVRQSAIEPWKMYLGQPVEGRVTNRYVIPATMGLTDYTGKFVGILLISVDIKTLTEHLGNQISQSGISFAIVNKSMTPLLQVAEEKDFAISVFPLKLLDKNAGSLLMQGNLFLGKGNYFYYHALTTYPYTVLVGYNLRYSDDVVRGILWSRLLQLLIIASFFVLFLWMMRARMIRPVLDITAAASAVSKGKSYDSARVQGPEEILALSEEITRIDDYIHENKRVEDELRNKLFMLKQAKELAEISTRSKSEFLAYACQEIRAALNHVIGFAQTMRDQLHGPIENRKYRQYAADIYSISNTLLGYTQDLLSFSKIETGYITLNERPLDLQEIVNKTLRFMADKMQSEKRNIKTKMQEPLPRLLADEFRLQQILTNMFLYLFHHTPAEQSQVLKIEVVSENRERMFYAITIASDDMSLPDAAELASWAEKLFAERQETPPHTDIVEADINLELIRSLAALHNAHVGVKLEGKSAILAVFFPTNRIRFSDATSN